jgi:serine/threonine protein kinase/tetratricopeptide (TPR) repeat protein
MSPCPDLDSLIRLLDEEFDRDEEDDLVTHVESCPGCQAELERLTSGRPTNTAEPRPTVARSSTNGAATPSPSPSEVSSHLNSSSDSTSASIDDLTADFDTPTEFRTDGSSIPEKSADSMITSGVPQLHSTGHIVPARDDRCADPARDKPQGDDDITIDKSGPDLEPTELGEEKHRAKAGQIPGYEIVAKLGQGGMGVVYKARQVGLNRLVALKMIIGGSQARTDHLARFRTEAEAVARLRHPNILHIYDIGEFDDVPFVALELLEGGDLADRLAGTPQPGRQAAELMVTLARAVHAAHQAGILHRDLKPTNILFTDDGVPKITDFGLAKRLDSDSKQTESGQIMGTPSYMAPEQARGHTKAVGPAADVYALGAILYEMLTGRPPFKGETPMETVRQVVDDEPVPPRRLVPKLARDLETICLKCLAKEPYKRYPSPAALADDLVRHMEGRPIQARPSSAWERSVKWTRRRPVAAMSLALGIAGALGLVGAGLVYNDYRSKLERQQIQKLDTERTRGTRELLQAQRDMDHGDLTSANATLLALRERIREEHRLMDLHDQSTGLLDQVEQRLEEQSARARQLAQHDEFQDKLTEARLHDLQLAALDPSGNRDAVQTATRAALAIFAADPQAPDDAWTLVQPLPAALSPQQQKDLVDDCYDLLLIQSESAPAARGLRILDQAARLRPRPSRAFHLRRAECLARARDPSGAAEERRLAEQAPPATALDHFLTGRTLYARKDIAGAIGQFEAALQINPDLFWAQVLMAYAKLQTLPAHPAEARTALTGCIQRQPNLVWLYLLRAFAFGQEGNVPSALADYRRALKRNLSDDLRYVLLVNRGGLHVQSGQLESAIADLEAAIRLKPGPFQAYQHLASVYQQQGQTSKAAAELTRAIAHTSDPTSLAGLHRSRALLVANHADLTPEQRDAAIADLDEALRRQPGTSPRAADVHVERGRFLFANRRNHDVLAACDAALKIVPDHTEAHALRIASLLDLNRYDEVLRSCEAYLARGKPTVRILEVRGLAHVARKDYAAAISDFTRAIEVKPDPEPAVRTRLYNQRGWAYHFADAPRLALADFESSLRLTPDQADALGGRGLARIRLGLWQPALRDAEAAIRLAKSSPAATDEARRAQSQAFFNAARIYAQSIEFAAREVSREGERAVVLYRRYRTRALELLKDALAPISDPSRREQILSDPALKPLRLAPRMIRSS